MKVAGFSVQILFALSGVIISNTSLAKETNIEAPTTDPEEDISREAINRFKNTYLNIKQQARRKNGLAEEESVKELFERHRRRHERYGRRKRLRRLSVDKSGSIPASWRSARKLQDTVISGFIISGLSPGLYDEDNPLFWCAGIDRNRVDDRGYPLLKQPIVHRNCVEVLQGVGGNFEAAWDIFWEIEVLDKHFTKTAQLPFVPSVATSELFMEISRQRKKKQVYIDARDDYDSEQLWDFRESPNPLGDRNRERLTRFNDHTWRPMHQLEKPFLCVESVVRDYTAKEYDTMRLEKCSNKPEKRKAQVWVYCYERESCIETEVDTPEYEITVTGDKWDDSVLETGNTESKDLRYGYAVPNKDDVLPHKKVARILSTKSKIEVVANDLKTDCDVEDDHVFFDDDMLQNHANYIDTRGIKGAEVTVETLCDTDDSEEYELETLVRIYEIDEDEDGVVNEYKCIDSWLLVCDEDGNEPRSISMDLDEGSRYLVLTTGATKIRPCDIRELDCQ